MSFSVYIVIFLSCSNGRSIEHGAPGTPNTPHVVDLSNYNFIGITLRHGWFIDQIAFVATSQTTGRTEVFGPFGGNGGGPGTIRGRMIQAFYGQAASDGIYRLGGKGIPM